MNVRLLFAAGGTGGHIFPAMAVADRCRMLRPDTHIEFVGTRGRLEEKVLPRGGYRLNYLWISGFEKGLSWKTALLPMKLGVSFVQALRLIGRLRPNGVICAGAYVSLPIGYAASMRGVPLILMESNAFPGLAIRKLAPRANEIHVAFKEAARHFPGLNVMASGNPVRQLFGTPIDRTMAADHFGLRADAPTLFAFGGSLGARSINKALDRCHEALRHKGIQIIWQTGTGYHGGERRESGLYRTTFLNEMELGYAAADLVLARAGATTIAELKAIGKPSILVPIPIEKVRQLDNARAMCNAGAAAMIADGEIEATLADAVLGLINDPTRLEGMGRRAGRMAVLDADDRIARHVLALAEQHASRTG